MRLTNEQKRARNLRIYGTLSAFHHDAHCELEHRNPFELLCATVMSAQTTDVAVNKVTAALFHAYPAPEQMAKALPTDLEPFIASIGMYRQKSKNLVGLSKLLVEKHQGRVPETLAELIELPGVGRKTANVVLGVAFGKSEGVVVDTHVQRISQRVGFTKEMTPEAIERDLMKLIPRSDWDRVSHVLIFHGRRICLAQRPRCEECPVNKDCPSAFKAENVGRKAAKPRPSRAATR